MRYAYKKIIKEKVPNLAKHPLFDDALKLFIPDISERILTIDNEKNIITLNNDNDYYSISISLNQKNEKRSDCIKIFGDSILLDDDLYQIAAGYIYEENNNMHYSYTEYISGPKGLLINSFDSNIVEINGQLMIDDIHAGTWVYDYLSLRNNVPPKCPPFKDCVKLQNDLYANYIIPDMYAIWDAYIFSTGKNPSYNSYLSKDNLGKEINDACLRNRRYNGDFQELFNVIIPYYFFDDNRLTKIIGSDIESYNWFDVFNFVQNKGEEISTIKNLQDGEMQKIKKY